MLVAMFVMFDTVNIMENFVSADPPVKEYEVTASGYTRKVKVRGDAVQLVPDADAPPANAVVRRDDSKYPRATTNRRLRSNRVDPKAALWVGWNSLSEEARADIELTVEVLTDDDPTDGGLFCGLLRSQPDARGVRRFCDMPAGWGTAHKGFGTCKLHGGNREVDSRAAKKLEVVAFLDGMVGDMMQYHADRQAGRDVDPLQAMAEVVTRAWVQVQVYGDLVAALGVEVTNRPEWAETAHGGWALRVVGPSLSIADLDSKGNLVTHEFVKRYEGALDQLAKCSKLAIDAGVELRTLQLQEKQVGKIASAIRTSLDALNLSEEQAEKVPEVMAGLLRAMSDNV